MSRHLTDSDFQLLLDGQLSEPDAERHRQHIHQCTACSQLFREYTRLYHLLDSESGLEPSAEFNEQLIRSLENVNATDHSDRWEFAGLSLLALLAAALSVFYAGNNFLLTLKELSSALFDGSLLSEIQSLPELLNMNPLLLAVAAVAFLLVAILDSLMPGRR